MKIAVLAGDGIGAEVTAQAVKVLRADVGSGAPPGTRRVGTREMGDAVVKALSRAR